VGEGVVAAGKGRRGGAALRGAHGREGRRATGDARRGVSRVNSRVARCED
jgi:hypothetical protein